MRAKHLLVVAAFVAIGATACGSSSENSTGSVTSAPASPGAAGSTTTGKFSGSSSSNFCDLACVDEKAFSGISPSGMTADDLKKEYEGLGPALQEAADKAPSEIKGDFQVFLDAFEPYLKALSDANYDFTKIDFSSFQGLSEPAVQAASDHIAQYVTQVCHVTPPTS